MNAMNRRAFLGRTTALVAASIAPIPKAMALADPEAKQLFWYAVGDDEMCYAFLAESWEDARREYAWVHGATIGEECPECGEYMCHEHNEDLNAPADWVEVNHKFDAKFGPGNEPKMVDWVRAGFNVPCENCDYGEPTECYVFEEKALCDECYEIARIAKLDDLIGNNYPTNLRAS